MHLIIGSKRFSTWSLRPWILMKELQIPFTETVIELDQPTTHADIMKHSPSGRVPALVDSGTTIWDSMAIIEYLAEKHPAVWPADKMQRAWARSVCAEMHSGFQDLRKNLPGQFLKTGLSFPKDHQGVQSDISRIKEIWREGLSRWKGPFLCGQKFTAVDAMYAPVVLGRFVPYGVTIESDLKAYVDLIAALPSAQQWAIEAASVKAA